ncbi:MAG: pilin [Patescibacteria group bacterium]
MRTIHLPLLRLVGLIAGIVVFFLVSPVSPAHAVQADCSAEGQGLNAQKSKVYCTSLANCTTAGGALLATTFSAASGNNCTGAQVCCMTLQATAKCTIADQGLDPKKVKSLKCDNLSHCTEAGGIPSSSSDCEGATPTCCQVPTLIANTEPKLIDPLNGATIFQVIRRLLSVFLGMVGALAFAVFVFAGVTWMTAGSSDRVKVAKDAMKYAVIGLVLIGFSFAITNFIVDALANKGSFVTPDTSTPATPQQLQ